MTDRQTREVKASLAGLTGAVCCPQNYVKAMRLFVGEPVWTAHNRPADHVEARGQYLAFLAQRA